MYYRLNKYVTSYIFLHLSSGRILKLGTIWPTLTLSKGKNLGLGKYSKKPSSAIMTTGKFGITFLSSVRIVLTLKKSLELITGKLFIIA